MVGLKAKAKEHSLNSLPATANGIWFNGQLSADRTTGAVNKDPPGLGKTLWVCLHIHTVLLYIEMYIFSCSFKFNLQKTPQVSMNKKGNI